MSKFFTKKTYFLALLLLSFVIVMKAEGINHANTLHWLWGGSTHDAQGVPSLQTATGLGWISLTSDNPPVSDVAYGVTIPTTDGPIVGYAWSSNLGWIRFGNLATGIPNAACPNGLPATPCVDARRVGDSIEGWARIMSMYQANIGGSANSGGWDGWIKLKGTATNGTPYGVTLVTDTNQAPPFDHRFQGYAWSNELGWIYFGSDAGTNPPLGIVSLGTLPPPGLNVTCVGSPNPAILTNNSATVSWSAFANNGVSPYSYTWSNLGGGSPNSGSGQSITTNYNTTGTKTANVTVTDSDGDTTNGVCVVEVNGEKDFDFREIIPFF